MRRGTGLLLASLVLLAGCGASVTGGTRDPGSVSTATLTPAPVPGETGPAGGRLLAPGLSTNGVFDPGALADAHRTTLTASGFSLAQDRTVFRPDARAASETLNDVDVRAIVAPGAGAYLFTHVERSSYEWPSAGAYGLISVWYSEPVVRNRFVDAGRGERYWGHDRPTSGGPIRDPSRTEQVRSDLAAVDLRVVGNGSANGTTVYRLRGSRIEGSDGIEVPLLVSDPRNVSMVARIDERGVVRSYRLSFDATFGEDRIRILRTHRIDVGDVTVGKPGWLPEANASVGTGGG